jgi:trigger factor
MSLNVNVQEGSAHERLVRVEVAPDEVERGLEEVARRIKQRAVLPGFRRGHVPLPVVRTQFADLVERDYLDEYLPRLAQQALDHAQVRPAVPPTVRNLQFNVGQPLRFEVQVDLRPQVEAHDWKGLRVAVQRRRIEEADVEQVLRGIQDDTAVFLDLDRPAERGDVVVVDSVRLDAKDRRLPSTRARNLRIQLGAPDVLPDIENGLLGTSVGQERTLAVNYPQDYGTPELAGRSVRYVVRVRKIQEKKLRPLDDNLAREVFKLDSIEALRERVRRDLEEEEAVRARRELEARVSDALLERHPFEVPPRLVDYMLERLVHELTQHRASDPAQLDALRERYRPGVERSLRRELVLESVARQEQLAVADEEVLKEIERMAAAQPREAARIRGRYHSAERREALRDELLERKALDAVVRAAQVDEETVGSKPLVVPASR